MNSVTQTGMDSPVDVLSSAADGALYRDQNEIREVFRKIIRRKRIVFATMFVLTFLALVAQLVMAPLFTATSVVMIDPRQSKVGSIESVLADAANDTEAVLSQVEILTSRSLIGKVVDKLNLVNDPEFNTDLKPPSFLSKLNPIKWIPQSFVDSIFGADPVLTPEQAQEVIRNRVIDLLLKKKLKVKEKTRTRIIEIAATSESSNRALELANSIADIYLVDQLEAKFEATQRVTNWLNDRLAELRKKSDESDRAVAAYRTAHGLLESYKASATMLGGKGVTLLQQQTADLTTQLTLARADRAAAEAKLRQVKEAESRPGGEESVADVLDSQLIQHLKEEESAEERAIAELSAQIGDRHPKMIAARAQLDDIKSKIKSEIRKVILSLENATNIARAREGAVQSQIEDIKRQLTTANSAEVELRSLEEDADANRTLMQSFLADFKSTSSAAAGNIQTPDARIIARADRPIKPSFPKIPLFTMIALFLSGVIGVALAFAAEHLDRGFRSGVQFEQETNIPVLAMVPAVEEDKGRPADYLIDRPMSSYAEAVRSVYTNLLLTQGNEPLKTIVISSCQPGEGKSTMAISLTRMIASSGHRVVLIEADLRRPSIHKQLGVERNIGLAEVLIGSSTFEDAMYQDPKSSAAILLAGKETINPSKLLSSHQMTDLVKKLTQEYEIVVIDSAPVLAVSDGLLLSNRADGTIYCCRWASTTRETAALGLKVLQEAGARIVGAAITVVDQTKSRTYGYADTSYYYYAKRYYSE